MTTSFLTDPTTGTPEATASQSFPNIPDSGDVAGIELRMLPPLVRDNHTPAFWPFPGRARLYCLTMVVSDAANQMAGLMDLNSFPRVGDNEYLPINKTIYYWQADGTGVLKPPSQLHVVCSIIKSKEALRETGTVLESVKNDADYKTVIDQLSSVVADTASFSLITGLAMQAADIVGRYLGRVDDQPIGTAVNSFTRLHGDWDKLGINPVTMSTKNVDFHFELVIRDQHRLPGTASVGLVVPAAYVPAMAHDMVPM